MSTLKKTIDFIVNQSSPQQVEYFFDYYFKNNFLHSFHELFREDCYSWLELVIKNNPEKKKELQKKIIDQELIKKINIEGYPHNVLMNDFIVRNSLLINEFTFKSKNQQAVEEFLIDYFDKTINHAWLNFNKQEKVVEKFLDDVEKYSQLNKQELSEVYSNLFEKMKIKHDRTHFIEPKFFAYLIEKYDIKKGAYYLFSKYITSDKIIENLPVLLKYWQKAPLENENFFYTMSEQVLRVNREQGEISSRAMQTPQIIDYLIKDDFLTKLIKLTAKNKTKEERLMMWIDLILQKNQEIGLKIIEINQEFMQRNIGYFFYNEHLNCVFTQLKNNWDFNNLKETHDFIVYLHKLIYTPHVYEDEEDSQEYYYQVQVSSVTNIIYQSPIHQNIYPKVKKQALNILASIKKEWLQQNNLENSHLLEVVKTPEMLEKLLVSNHLIKNKDVKKMLL